jgi:hypothetical protein
MIRSPQGVESLLMVNADCLVCRGPDADPVLELVGVPAQCTELHRSRDAALATTRGDLRLAYCHRCTAVTNRAFEPAGVEYGADYENSQMFSPRFRSYAEDLCRHLTQRFDLAGGHVVEVGSGKGEFLSLLCEIAGSRGTGFDPTFVPPDGGAAPDAPVRFVTEMFDEHSLVEPPDLVCFRHVLEHLDDPVDVLGTIRRGMGERSALYVEVPDAAFTFTDTGLWDLIYQHCTYFTAEGLEYALRAAGFEPTEVRVVFDGQFLAAEARPRGDGAGSAPPGHDALRRQVIESGARFGALIDQWRDRLTTEQSRGRRTALWGAGAKGVTFLNLVAPPEGPHPVEAAVDVNVRKHGTYLPGTGHLVEPPEALAATPPDVVIVANPAYAAEISAALHDLGIDASIETL